MTNTIEIPTYEALIPNSTYGRKTEPVRNPVSEEMAPATQILQLSRYVIPCEDEIINLIQSAARDFTTRSTAWENQTSQEEIPLTEFIKMIPLDEVKRISEGSKDALSHLRSHCTKGTYQTGRTYLQFNNGVIPNEVLDPLKEIIRENGAIHYREIVSRIGINEWYLSVRLNNKDGFPNKLELEYLLDRGVRDCDVFRVNGDYGNYQTAANQLRSLYDILNSPTNIRKITDYSDYFLKSKAATTIKEVATCLIARNAISNLAGSLMGMPTEPRTRGINFGHHGGGYSLN